jgi:hypothetical protein
MRTATIALEGLTIERLLEEAARTRGILLTAGGNVRFVLLPADGNEQTTGVLGKKELLA